MLAKKIGCYFFPLFHLAALHKAVIVPSWEVIVPSPGSRWVNFGGKHFNALTCEALCKCQKSFAFMELRRIHLNHVKGKHNQ